METAITIVAAYALGSISFAIVVSRLMRLPDPRSYGSKNPGATNVLRTGRKAAAILTLLGDAGKGWLAVWLAAQLGGDVPAAGLAVFAGHLLPVFHRFQGGKGVATAAGVLFGFNAWLGLATVATWMAIGLLLIWRHRDNIARLAAGTESRLGRKSASPPDPNAASR